jgi:hypothetical protein
MNMVASYMTPVLAGLAVRDMCEVLVVTETPDNRPLDRDVQVTVTYMDRDLSRTGAGVPPAPCGDPEQDCARATDPHDRQRVSGPPERQPAQGERVSVRNRRMPHRELRAVLEWLGGLLAERGVERIAAEELTVPPGGLPSPGPVSVTVAVHSVEPPAWNSAGSHTTSVSVVRTVTVTVVWPVLPAWARLPS